ncbi:MAG: GNAT family N-acetyltransferase [Kofleriaceae bacterium]|nr:GNAT family N-acetyltransferase [Kofleriaceae bacterium]
MNADVELVPCDAARDGAFIRDLTRANFFESMKHVWREERHQREPMNPERYTMLRRAGETIGFFAVRRDEDCLYVQTIQLVPAARGTGIGTQAMHHIRSLAAGAPVVRLRVLRSNTGARRLYERLGYRTVSEDDEGFIMELALL